MHDSMPFLFVEIVVNFLLLQQLVLKMHLVIFHLLHQIHNQFFCSKPVITQRNIFTQFNQCREGQVADRKVEEEEEEGGGGGNLKNTNTFFAMVTNCHT